MPYLSSFPRYDQFFVENAHFSYPPPSFNLQFEKLLLEQLAGILHVRV